MKNSTINKPDNMDIRILAMLQDNAKLTIKELAAELQLTSTPIYERIKRLEKDGLIDRYVAILNPRMLGKKLYAFIHISIKDHSKEALETFVDHVTRFPEVLECHHISGDSDFVLKVVFADMEAYNDFVLDRLSVVPNIGQVQTKFSLSVRKNTTAIPLS